MRRLFRRQIRETLAQVSRRHCRRRNLPLTKASMGVPVSSSNGLLKRLPPGMDRAPRLFIGKPGRRVSWQAKPRWECHRSSVVSSCSRNADSSGSYMHLACVWFRSRVNADHSARLPRGKRGSKPLCRPRHRLMYRKKDLCCQTPTPLLAQGCGPMKLDGWKTSPPNAHIAEAQSDNRRASRRFEQLYYPLSRETSPARHPLCAQRNM